MRQNRQNIFLFTWWCESRQAVKQWQAGRREEGGEALLHPSFLHAHTVALLPHYLCCLSQHGVAAATSVITYLSLLFILPSWLACTPSSASQHLSSNKSSCHFINTPPPLLTCISQALLPLSRIPFPSFPALPTPSPPTHLTPLASSHACALCLLLFYTCCLPSLPSPHTPAPTQPPSLPVSCSSFSFAALHCLHKSIHHASGN